MLEGYLRALIDSYHRSYEIALKGKDKSRAFIFKGILNDLLGMANYMKELDSPKDEVPEEPKDKHMELVFAGKMSDLPEFLKKKLREE